MSDETRTPTEQEAALYDALHDGDHDAIAALRQAARDADPTRPEGADEDWRPPREQFDLDHRRAWTRYQAYHEPHETEREQNTAEQVDSHNQDASAAAGEEPGRLPHEVV